MANKKDLVIAVLATFCLTAAFFAIMPVSSLGTYDPWLDINDDGKIDLKDYYTVGKAYGTYGNPAKNVIMTRSYYCCYKGFTNMAYRDEVLYGNDTAGYDRVSLLIIIWHMNAWVQIRFQISEYISFAVENFTINGGNVGGQASVTRVYDVLGTICYVDVINIGTTVGDVGIYMYVTA